MAKNIRDFLENLFECYFFECYCECQLLQWFEIWILLWLLPWNTATNKP